MRNINPIYHHSAPMLNKEREWIKLAKDNPEFFAPLYEKYYKQIFRYISHRVDNRQMACDVTSQVFFKAIKNIKNYEYRGVPLSSWLYRIAISEINQAYRNKQSRRTIEIDHVQVYTFMKVFEEETNSLNKKRLFSALATLNEKDLQLIKLRYFENQSYREIGEMVGIKENYAKVKTFRALKTLKKKFYNLHF